MTYVCKSVESEHQLTEHSPLLMAILSTKMEYPTSLQTSCRKTGRSMIEA